tara:strand:+ start:1319 stop:1885 length:567 start_codon:yes stop_codon:yes gene_type:complete
MEILTKEELKLRYDEIIKKIKEGAIFIHPTDTIYGISCNALNEKSVAKIRELKERVDNPFSVWVPSLDWIKNNCILSKEGKEWLKELPGPYTFILEPKTENIVAKNVAPKKTTLGVRLPNHWFSEVVNDVGLPLVTTSVNKAGKSFMVDRDDLDQEIERGVSFLIYEGVKKGRPSKIVDLVKGEEKER